MGTSDLIARLERDADDRVGEISSRAEAEALEIEEAAARAAAIARETELARRRAVRRARLDRELEEARHRARLAVAGAERALVDRVALRAEAGFELLERDPAYRDALAAQIAEALLFLGDTPCVARCRPALAPIARAAGCEVEEVRDMPVGVRFVAKDGSVEIDDTLSARLSRARPELAMSLVTEALR